MGMVITIGVHRVALVVSEMKIRLILRDRHTDLEGSLRTYASSPQEDT